MVTTGRGAQVVAAPVIDHIMPVVVFLRKAISSVELMVRTCATFVPPLIVVATILLAA
jgi:hypothetical protein